MNTETNKLHLPALRAKMGDWFYYVTVLTFEEVAKRVKQPREIEAYNENEKKLGEWIQRELDPKRINQIVEYLNSQEQRFFNSLILGIYGGSPFWQDIRFEPDSLDERIVDYINKTLGILTLSGDENIFAIDGQHRAKGIQEAVAKNPELKDEEVSVIFIAHKTDIQGLVRTRRVFSTLNRYAKPVNQSDIIKLSEDDNAAIITRMLIEKYDLFSEKILMHKNASINNNNTTHFSTIITIYSLVKIWLLETKNFGIKADGLSKTNLDKRESETFLDNSYNSFITFFNELVLKVPSLHSFFIDKQPIIREYNALSSLLFRPIGQEVMIRVFKFAFQFKLQQEAFNFFATDRFNIQNTVWNKIFWKSEKGVIDTEASGKDLAVYLILGKIGISNLKPTSKLDSMLREFDINLNDL